ncbi:tRNA uridine-5-carboxymethylaminomethyl(34) synthesis GTPase MnmE, partial [Rhizobium leguminosarum]
SPHRAPLNISPENPYAGDGLPELRRLIGDIIDKSFTGLSMAIPSRQRHKDSLAKCLEALDAAISQADMNLELRTEQLR